MEVKVSEIQHGSLHLVRRCRIVTYLMGKDHRGREEAITEVDDATANELIRAIATSQAGPDRASSRVTRES